MAKSSEGGASVDKAPLPAKSAPVIRESGGGDFASVTRRDAYSLRLAGDQCEKRQPGRNLPRRMIAMVEGAQP